MQAALSRTENIGLAWDAILAFLRIATSPRIFAAPLQLDSAVSVIDEWLKSPHVMIVGPTEQHWSIFTKLLPAGRARGSLIMDAHLAALAIEHGAVLCPNDRDFMRFPGLKVDFPLQ